MDKEFIRELSCCLNENGKFFYVETKFLRMDPEMEKTIIDSILKKYTSNGEFLRIVILHVLNKNDNKIRNENNLPNPNLFSLEKSFCERCVDKDLKSKFNEIIRQYIFLEESNERTDECSFICENKVSIRQITRENNSKEVIVSKVEEEVVECRTNLWKRIFDEESEWFGSFDIKASEKFSELSFDFEAIQVDNNSSTISPPISLFKVPRYYELELFEVLKDRESVSTNDFVKFFLYTNSIESIEIRIRNLDERRKIVEMEREKIIIYESKDIPYSSKNEKANYLVCFFLPRCYSSEIIIEIRSGTILRNTELKYNLPKFIGMKRKREENEKDEDGKERKKRKLELKKKDNYSIIVHDVQISNTNQCSEVYFSLFVNETELKSPVTIEKESIEVWFGDFKASQVFGILNREKFNPNKEGTHVILVQYLESFEKSKSKDVKIVMKISEEDVEIGVLKDGMKRKKSKS